MKPIYQVFVQTPYGIGLQAVKADNKVQARQKFKKRFPKKRILLIEKATSDYNPVTKPI